MLPISNVCHRFVSFIAGIDGLEHGVAFHLCNIDSSIVPWFEPKTNELKDFSCWFRARFVLFRARFVPFSSLVCAIFELGSWHFRAWFVRFSSQVRSIFEPSLYHFRAWFVPFSSPLSTLFEHASRHFRA